MNTRFFFEALSELDDRYIEEALDYRRKKERRFALPKWVSAVACLCLTVAAVRVITFYKTKDFGAGDTAVSDTALAPTITVMGKNYTAPDMPTEQLPAGYRYLRNLTKKEANGTDLAGCAIYVDPQDADMRVLYLYQECGTPIGENAVDNTERQWAYVKWTVTETESEDSYGYNLVAEDVSASKE